MKNPLAIVIVVILAVGLGVMLSYQQTSSPLMQQFLMQQKEIIEGQRRIEQSLNAGGSSRQIAMLERKIDGLVRSVQSAPPTRPAAPQRPSDEYTKVHEIPVGDSAFRGPKDAPVTIVEFMDFQCPFCARFHPALDEVVEEYPGQVRHVVKNFPLGFHQQARPAAKAALAAKEQGKYWEMADGLLANFKNLNEETINGIAEDIGLDVKKFHRDLEKNDARYEAIIQADMDLARKVNVRGTPTFYINGRKTQARTLQAYKAEIEKILNQ